MTYNSLAALFITPGGPPHTSV